MDYTDFIVKQQGRDLTLLDSSKIVINKYDNKVTRIVFEFDETIPGRYYFAMKNPVTGKYRILPIINNHMVIGTNISSYPGTWSSILIVVDEQSEIINDDIDETKFTFVSNPFSRIVVRNNFLNEEDIEEDNDEMFPIINEILDNLVKAQDRLENAAITASEAAASAKADREIVEELMKDINKTNDNIAALEGYIEYITNARDEVLFSKNEVAENVAHVNSVLTEVNKNLTTIEITATHVLEYKESIEKTVDDCIDYIENTRKEISDIQEANMTALVDAFNLYIAEIRDTGSYYVNQIESLGNNAKNSAESYIEEIKTTGTNTINNIVNTKDNVERELSSAKNEAIEAINTEKTVALNKIIEEQEKSVENVQNAESDAITSISNTKEAINQSIENGVSVINTAKTNALSSIENAKDAYEETIANEKQSAITDIQAESELQQEIIEAKGQEILDSINNTPIAPSEEMVESAVDAYLSKNPITETDPTVSAWAKQPTKPKYTASEVGADPSGTATSTVSNHNVSTEAHNDIRVLLTELSAKVTNLLNSDDETLDQTKEIVDYIKANRGLIESVTTEKVNVTDIINNLTTNLSNKVLAASQGVVLKQLIDALQTTVNNLPSSIEANIKKYVDELMANQTGVQIITWEADD